MAYGSEWVGVLPPRLLQDHSPSGEPGCTGVVQTPRGSGEHLVSGSENSACLGLAHVEAVEAMAAQPPNPESVLLWFG